MIDISQSKIRIQNARRAIVACLWLAVLCEAFTVLATQDKAVRATSPWRDDPFDLVVSAALFMVPALALVVGARLLAWSAAGASERARQMVRASGLINVVVLVTAGFEWASVVTGNDRGWNDWTAVLLVGLGLVSLSVAVTAVLLARARTPGSLFPTWAEDWLGDALLLCGQIPGLQRVADPRLAAWMRRRALLVFLACSLLASGGVVAALALGEGWTNPALFGWAFGVETTLLVAFCVMTNAVAGFIARPALSWLRRTVESAAVSGCILIQVAVAFRDAIWRQITGHAAESLSSVVVLTGAAGLIGVLGAGLALLAWRRPPGTRPSDADCAYPHAGTGV